ncbi:hypothetical protein PVBG_05570 [Plasmodium vivax Brazil I]|uniref:Uncharacterized protein n=1 Tax=Plasmodium vivax (strain Brazil I) TaxID=1033975 RepID=A0A0J9T0R7_PLAV1|nr:hypothetical protein PVBG_05570 [Plasmodium vivax Brazil I]
MKNNKNAFIKKIFSKYGLRFILFALSPMLGIIFPILFEGPKGQQLIPHCWASNHPAYISRNPNVKCDAPYKISHDILGPIYVLNFVLFYILLIIVFLTILYTIKKVMKYERLKSGKGKMKGK